MKCRHCAEELTLPMIDLGNAPPSNAYLTESTIKAPEKWFPLKVMVCNQCWLVQTEDYAGADELFDENYAYFSSFSTSWLNHAQKYVNDMAERFKLDHDSYVIEVAANDGYLLQYVKLKQIPCLGIEPTLSTAQAAREKGIDIIEEFFGVSLAKQLVKQGKSADLTAANNVLAHVPDINDFVAGFAYVLKPSGVSTFEFPHLYELIKHNQFDTIYHEHFSYLSLTAVKTIFEKNGLEVFDVEQIPTHGGSLRVYAQKKGIGQHPISTHVASLLKLEFDAGIESDSYYGKLQASAEKIKNDLLLFLIQSQKEGKRVIGYGAAAKGNTLLNYAGVRPDLLPYVVDRNPAKQNKYLPGSRIPIVDESIIKATKPEYVLILPWNLSKEVMEQLSYIKEWGGSFVTAIPSLKVYS